MEEDIKEEIKWRKYSRYVLAGLTLVLLFLGYSSSKLEFDYDFEKFFPQEDSDLVFYEDYREKFENDNDFILLGFANEKGVFDQQFLQKVRSFTTKLRTLPHLREVVSPLEMSYLELAPGVMGVKRSPIFHLDQPEKYEADRERLAKSNEPVAEMVNLENNSFILVVKNKQQINKDDSDELAKALQELIDLEGFEEIHVMGKIMGQQVYVAVMKVEFLTFASISIFVLIIFLIIAYRALWGILIPLATVLLAIIGSLGFMQLSGTPLNMMTTLLPVIMLVVGMSDVVHLVSKYLEEIRYGRTKTVAIKNMLKKVGVATLLTSLTTALGFVTLIGVGMEPIQNFGIFTAVGVLLAFVLSILFIPAIFLNIKKPKITDSTKVQNAWERGLGKFFIRLCRNQKTVLVAYSILTIICILGASQIKFDYFLMQDLGEDQPLMQDLRYFQKQYGGIRPFEMAVIPAEGKEVTDYDVIRDIEKLEVYLNTEYGVNQMITPAVPFKFANKALRNGRDEYYKIPDNEKRFDYLKRQMEKFEGREEFQQIVSADKKVGRVFGRMIDPGSRAMIYLNDSLEVFYANNIDASVLSYKLTGTPAIIDEAGRHVSENIVIGLLFAFLLIGISMAILFKSIKIGFISLVPNIFPILLTAGYIGFAGIDLNMSTAIVFTIAFGIAVDDTIHFLSRFRQEMVQGRTNLFALRRTFISTGKAIIITSIILLGGFGSLIFSNFLSTFYIGLFVCMTLVFAVITDLTLLPMMLLKKKK
ncbi:MMPL family transporter [Vicingaceae bacterium]|nr:MMPL family transporter [Vicingaceae bacterium]MDC1451390.1 MMPL family transporter [Vicingaceae bacterium]